MSDGLLELRVVAEAFAHGPAPERGDVVPAKALHDFAEMVLPVLLAAERSSSEPTWEEREALSDAIQRLHMIDLNNLGEVVDTVIAAGWRPTDRSE